MQIHVVENYEKMSELAANYFAEVISAKTTSSTVTVP